MQPNLKTIRARISAYYRGSTPPATNDMLWYDTTVNQLKLFVSGQWQPVPSVNAGGSPSGTTHNVPYFDDNYRMVTDNRLLYSDGRFSINYDSVEDVLNTLDVKSIDGGASIQVKSESSIATVRVSSASGNVAITEYIVGGDLKFTTSYDPVLNGFKFRSSGAASDSLVLLDSGGVRLPNLGTGAITGTESTFAVFDNSGKLLESNILKIGAAPDGGGAIGINTAPDWPLHIKGGVFNMALIESTANTARLLFKTSTSTISPLIEVIGDNMLLDASKVTVKNTHLDSPTSGGDSRILGIDVNNKIILSDGIRVIPNLSGLPTLDLRNVDTYVTNTLAGFDGTKIVNNPHIQITQGGGFTNVGIGGTPQFPLHVFGDTRNNAMFVEGQNNETRLAIRDLSGGNIYMASRFGVMKLFSNSSIQLWAGGTNRATVNANGTLTLSTYGLGNNIGSEATFPVFDSTGVIRESRLITTDGTTVSITDLDLTSDNVNALLLKLPSYLDESAAIAAGLPTGHSYYNQTTKSYSRV